MRHDNHAASGGHFSLAFFTGENPYVSDLIKSELSWQPPFSTPDAVRRTVGGAAA